MASLPYENPYVDPYPGATQSSVDMRRRYALGVLQQAGDGTPTKANAIGAIARALQGAMGGYLAGQADQSDLADKAQTQSLIQRLIGGGEASGTPANPSAIPPAATSPMAGTSQPPAETPFSSRFGNWQQGPGGPGAISPAPQQTPQPQYASAISGIESGGKYDLLGPVTRTGDRAYGKYQVMGANVPQWTQEVLGKPMAPQEFLNNPQAQDAVFNAKFGQYAQKYGPEGAARAWFAGEGGMNDPNRSDQLGTTVASYAKQFNAGMGGQQPFQVASLNPTAQPSPDSAQPSAPAAPPQQVAQNAQGVIPPAGDPNRAALIAQLLATRSGGAIGTALAGKLIDQQIAPPEFKTITDMTGAQVPYWVRPNTQTMTPAQVPGGGGPGGAASGDPQDIMAAAEAKYPGVTNRVEQLYRGEGGLPNKRTNPLDGAATQLIQQVHPDWNMTMWTAKNKMQQQLSSGSAQSIGGQIVAARNAFEHLANTTDLLTKKNNYDLGTPLLSYPANLVTNQTTGQQDLINQINRESEIYGGERTKAITGSEGTREDRIAFQKALGPETSAPPAMAGTVEGEYAQLKGALLNKEQQVREQLGEDYLAKRPVITPELKQNMKRIETGILKLRGNAPPDGASQPAAAAAQPSAPAAQPASKVINGKTYINQNGQWYEQ